MNKLLPTKKAESIISAFEIFAEKKPDAIALLAPGESSVTYGGLFESITGIQHFLSSKGLGREDRVALLLPNGIEMALMFLGILANSVAAPLNPAYKPAEIEFYLSATKAEALIVNKDTGSVVELVARDKGIPVYGVSDILKSRESNLTEAARGKGDGSLSLPQGTDTAIILHTSGTTSSPKSVPLSHANLLASATNIAESLNLTEADRCLNIMPLFHVHGMIGVLLSSLSAMASVVCPAGFQPLRFISMMQNFKPTWYSAVPTMHQVILERAHRQTIDTSMNSLRLIRSCSSALPPRVMQELEDTFHVPVIEAYGMTEASHQISSNPLPPGIRKPGSVGLPTGTEIAIIDNENSFIEGSDIGEIVIRGTNVTKGYENNDQANSESFVLGWFRTGDQGFIDPEGFLIITGRIKEIINRGGEKIAPREVDEVILKLSAVSQAVAFPVPHPKLGEDIAVAVVLKEGQSIDVQEIRNHAATYLTKFKVPRQIFIVDKIQKGPTGKIQRATLWDQFKP
jgi:acyl-CoA synthetase (AMP-forming)/AMP-acid ligase II